MTMTTAVPEKEATVTVVQLSVRAHLVEVRRSRRKARNQTEELETVVQGEFLSMARFLLLGPN